MLRLWLRVFCVLVPVLCWTDFTLAQTSAPTIQNWKLHLAEQSSQTGSVTLFRISGSNTIGAALAPRLVAHFLQAEGMTDISEDPVGENETAVSGIWSGGERPMRLSVSIMAHGSSTGFKALALGDADLAASSRPIKAAELLSLAEFGNLSDSEHEHIIAIDGLAIIVNPANPVRQLNTRQITDLFTGKRRNWHEVGGSSAPVKIYARDGQSGTFDTFERLVLQGATLSAQARRFESNDLLAKSILTDVNGIGFVPLASIGSAQALVVSDGVATGLAPTILTVATEDYPLARRLYFYSKSPALQSPALSAFLAFTATNEGQQVVGETGFVAQALHSVDVVSSDARLDDWKRLNLNIRFTDRSSELDNKAQADVARLAAYLQSSRLRQSRLTLVGYSIPGAATSQATLSRLRAQNVRWALREQGVRGKLETLAGEAESVADPASINADRNRRVEIWIR